MSDNQNHDKDLPNQDMAQQKEIPELQATLDATMKERDLYEKKLKALTLVMWDLETRATRAETEERRSRALMETAFRGLGDTYTWPPGRLPGRERQKCPAILAYSPKRK